MTAKTLLELLAGKALGALDSKDEAVLDALTAHDPDLQKEVAELIDAAALFAVGSSPEVKPPRERRSKILASIAGVPQLKQTTATQPPPRPGFRFVLNSEHGWVESGVPGFRTKLLSQGPQPGYQVMLMQLDPGASVPHHEHAGTEEIYMLTGHLDTEGRILAPGDYMRAESGTDHPHAKSHDGCLALLILGPVLAS
jgi:quercetin dioxygenase-like cupin family protein